MTLRRLIVLAFALLAPAAARAQQIPDSTFDTSVPRPAFTARHPKILFDEAHHNFHTSTGRYRAFADLATHDGCVVTPNHAAFSAASLAGHDVLVIANALGADNMADSAASHAAFTDPECDAVLAWVRGGGALLLIADHTPMGAAAHTLGARFGVDMRNGVTVDSSAAHHVADRNPSLIVYTRANGGLADHAITRGRDSTERLAKIVTFTGQSLTGPPGSIAILRVSDSARDLIAPSLQAAAAMEYEQGLPAAGRAQGLAFTVGKGRVVVLGEAAMLSAQLAGPMRAPMGMNVPGSDDRQLALNVVRWLGGALEPDASAPRRGARSSSDH